MSDHKYALTNALIYTTLVALILLGPLFFYFIYMKNIHSIQNELLLKEKATMIIKSMQDFNQNDKYFEYPRFKTFQSGLYDMRFKPIFSLITYDIKNFKEGYHLNAENAYLIVRLPKDRYFGAEYLIVKNNISYATIYENIMAILISIAIVVFALSIFFLDRFAQPFKRINERLDNFIKDSIHEINTPLAIININIDLYNRKNPENKYMQRVKAASKVLSNIYNDMDYLIKYDRVEHKAESVNLTKFLKDRIEYFSDVAFMKNLEIQSEIEENIYLFIDLKKLQRVVDNTISNAIKYSYEENIIYISLHVRDGFCYMVFQDHGIGIKDIDKIFTRYYRENSNKGGFGIGLNIVKSIIDQVGIILTIESQPKLGSTFIYKLPQDLVTIN